MANEGELPGDSSAPTGRTRDHRNSLTRLVAAGDAAPFPPRSVVPAHVPPDLAALVERLLAENGRLVDRIREQVEEIAHLRERLRQLEQQMVAPGRGE
jgi:hypothetical protein